MAESGDGLAPDAAALALVLMQQMEFNLKALNMLVEVTYGRTPTPDKLNEATDLLRKMTQEIAQFVTLSRSDP